MPECIYESVDISENIDICLGGHNSSRSQRELTIIYHKCTQTTSFPPNTHLNNTFFNLLFFKLSISEAMCILSHMSVWYYGQLR